MFLNKTEILCPAVSYEMVWQGDKGTRSSPSENLSTRKEHGHWGVWFMCIYAEFQLELVTYLWRCFVIICKAVDMSYESLAGQSCQLSHSPCNASIAHFKKKCKSKLSSERQVLSNKAVFTIFCRSHGTHHVPFAPRWRKHEGGWKEHQRPKL